MENLEISDELQSISGIGVIIAERLMEIGICSIAQLATTPLKRLVDAGLSKSHAWRILEEAVNQCLGKFGFLSGDALLRAQQRSYLTSGVSALDKMLGGKGFESQRVYEVYGPEGSGKSTLLHQLICTAFLPPERGGLGTGAIYIDCEGAFRLKYVCKLAKRFGIDPDVIARQIYKATPPNSDALVFLCEQVLPRVVWETGSRLICLDTIATYFRSEYGACTMSWPERNQAVARVFQAIRHQVECIDGVAVITNQVEENKVNFPRRFVHWGLIWHQDAQARLLMRRRQMGPPTECEVRLENAFDLPPKKGRVTINDDGIVDSLTKQSYTRANSKPRMEYYDEFEEVSEE